MKLTLVLITALFSNSSFALQKKTILLNPAKAPIAFIYFGPGVCDGCETDLSIPFLKLGYRVQAVYPGQLTPEFLAEADVFVVPGGDFVNNVRNAFKPGEISNIKQYVQNGGHYLGTCLGAYLAASPYSQIPGIDLFRGAVYQHSKYINARMENVTWQGQHRWLYFQDGPEFHPDMKVPSLVWATYITGAPAAVQQDLGKGRIGLIGPHPEANESWWKDDGITDPDGEDSFLFKPFLKALLDPNPLTSPTPQPSPSPSV